jgi:hypothetical protein
MKILFRLFALAYFISFSFNANLSFAQIKFGPKVGLNFSELPNNTEYIIGKHKIYTGYHFGVIAEMRLVKELFIQPGVLITNKGSKYIVGNNTGGSTSGFSDFQFSSFYTDIPINLVYKIDHRTYKLLLIAGPQIGYGLSGKWKASDGISSKVHFGNNPVDDLKPFDYGFDLGAGVEFGRIQFSSLYYMGLKTLSTLNPPLKEQKHKVLSISVAYLFGKEKRDYKNYSNKFCRTYDDQLKRHRRKHY